MARRKRVRRQPGAAVAAQPRDADPLACPDAPAMTAGSLLAGSLALLRTIAPRAVPLVLAFQSPLMVGEMLSERPLDQSLSILWGLALLVCDGAVLGIAAQAQRGAPMAIGRALRAALVGYGAMFVTALVAEILTLLFALLLLVPGVMRLLSYSVAIPIALHEGRIGRDACDHSEARMHGHRLAALGPTLLAWLPSLVVLAIGLWMDTELVVPRGEPAPLEHRLARAGYHLLGGLAALPVSVLAALLYERTRAPGPSSPR